MNSSGQKIIWNKGYEEVTIESLYESSKKWDLICNGDRNTIHVCIKEEEIENSKGEKK